MTKAWRLLVPLGDLRFFWASDAIMLAAGLAGFEMLLNVLKWKGRWLARGFFVASAPQMLGLLSGNPSNLLLLGYGAAALAMARGRPLLGGLLLGSAWLKPPVGLPVALALLVAFPAPVRQRWRAACGAAGGTLVFALANVAAGGVTRTLNWVGKLVPFLDGLSAHPKLVPGHCCMAGAPAPFLDILPTPAAIGLGLALVGGVVLLAMRHHGWSPEKWPQPFAPLAVLTSAALLATPYIHLNDLVLDALPLLLLSSLPLGAVSRMTLIAWGLGLELALAVALASRAWAPATFYDRVSFGLVLSAMALVGLATAANARGTSYTSAPSHTDKDRSAPPSRPSPSPPRR